MKLLLASTSKLHGGTYLDYLENELPDFFGKGSKILFVPYARPGGMSWDAYTALARGKLGELGFAVRGIHTFSGNESALEWANGIFTGGGNTFVLLKTLQDSGALPLIREAVREGKPYMGSSAGTNMAGLTIGTTNDMPIVHPNGFDALGLVPFNINPHYLDPEPGSKHMGETRETRILEFHHFNTQPVVGLREGSWLRMEGRSLELKGSLSARVFRQNSEPEELPPGDFSHLL